MGIRSDVGQVLQVGTVDGRQLRAEMAGDGRRVIVVQVGTPNAGVLFEGWVRDAAARGLTLIAYDRPGYGESSPRPGRVVADCAADVRAISEAVGFSRCAVWGFSGGGPHALACAALLKDLVAAVATIGSLAPLDAPGFDYFAGMSDAARADYELFLSDPGAWEREGLEQRDAEMAASLDQFRENLSQGSAAGDVAALSGDFGAWLHRAVQQGLAPGVDGWLADDIAFHSPWGFDLAEIEVPVKIWHGVEDHRVPVAHGRFLAAGIPDAQAEIRDDDGHMAVPAFRIAEVHKWLAQYVCHTARLVWGRG